MTEGFRAVTECRICGQARLSTFLSLGETPLANAFIAPDAHDFTEARYPLAVARCQDCGLVQLTVVVAPEIMFGHYVYASSASTPLLAHFDGLAEVIAARYAPTGSLVVEMGSNDGVLLGHLRRRGIRPLGIEPARNLAGIANAAGLETWNEFFGSRAAARVREDRGSAAVIVGTNVLAHIDDVADVVRGLDELLSPDGVFVAEVPYLADLLERVEYDTIYHEHLSYFAVAPLARLLARADIELIDVEKLPIHGGSIRIHAARRGRRPVSAVVSAMVEAERRAGLAGPAAYERFAHRVEASREVLREVIGGVRSRGQRVAGLGATAKGNTLLNFCGLGPEAIEFIGDSTPLKQGMLTPGMRIPVREERAIIDEAPDYTLLLAWNYADEIIARHRDYLSGGGRFIHPIPEARIISDASTARSQA